MREICPTLVNFRQSNLPLLWLLQIQPFLNGDCTVAFRMKLMTSPLIKLFSEVVRTGSFHFDGFSPAKLWTASVLLMYCWLQLAVHDSYAILLKMTLIHSLSYKHLNVQSCLQRDTVIAILQPSFLSLFAQARVSSSRSSLRIPSWKAVMRMQVRRRQRRVQKSYKRWGVWRVPVMTQTSVAGMDPALGTERHVSPGV